VHPDDVADYVAEAVAELERRVGQTDLPIDELELRRRTELRLRLRLRSHQAVTVLTGPPPPKPVAIPLARGAPAPPPGGGVLFGPGGLVAQQSINVPDLGSLRTRELILRVDCSDFDGQPPLAELLAPDGTPLPGPQWPYDPRRQGIVHGHPKYGRPFFCRRGLREYHEHPQHEDDPWDRWREGMPLYQIVVGIVTDLRDRFTFRR
jgi:hypothetical protein